ncbi:hypothetical protein HOS58_gp31 [Streptomyces phage Attoomi]|uniref:Uncharacterized protein n=1 Tax=Streptomyces phage Attoomi TaxID=2059881 RepID=A0A2H5BLI5_9CAUD|nr:hypothetical protein HOS58_gp31 [Streptomyces phage Attoomi]AUG87163.1 hypothetical protein SEA_ATTOOMI_31 [Streptomyces phage Attoomi]
MTRAEALEAAVEHVTKLAGESAVGSPFGTGIAGKVDAVERLALFLLEDDREAPPE